SDQQTDTDQHHQKIRAAITDEREWQSFVWQRARDDADIDKRLQGDQKRDARTEQQPKQLPRIPRNINPTNHQHNERQDHQQGGDQTQFLTDDRKNKIGVVFGNETELLATFTQASASQAARPQR